MVDLDFSLPHFLSNLLWTPEAPAGSGALGAAQSTGDPTLPGTASMVESVQAASITTQSLGEMTLEVGLTLGILLLVIYAAYFLLRRFGRVPGSFKSGGKGGKEKSLTFISQMGISPKKSLLVVQFLNQKLLIGVTEQSMVLLAKEEARENDLENYRDYDRNAGLEKENEQKQSLDFKDHLDETNKDDSF